jgi:hypothetical protein
MAARLIVPCLQRIARRVGIKAERSAGRILEKNSCRKTPGAPEDLESSDEHPLAKKIPLKKGVS